MEAPVQRLIGEARSAVEESPRSAEAWGRFGMICHVHDLTEEAIVAYRHAAALAPDDIRWVYFLGDVLQTAGTDLQGAESSLRRAVELDPSYAPAHMRLAKVLVARGLPGAGPAFERALELDPDLQPARVGLAQLRLAEGRIEEAAAHLEEVIRVQPRNGRALAALAQAYTRLRRRDEARVVASKAREAGDFNLFADPLMSQVVALGASSNLLWERAKAYFEAENYQQAILGLSRVVDLLPDNAGVHHQLAFAYRETGNTERALAHLARSVELEPERADARVQLAGLLLEHDRPREAADHLRRVFSANVQDAESGWLLANALLRDGDPVAALDVLAEAARRAQRTGSAIPAWANNDWGSALAQQSRFIEAAERFRDALASEPRNAQSLFYLGLAMEGLGRPRQAVTYYEQAMEIAPNELVASRLDALTGPPR